MSCVHFFIRSQDFDLFCSNSKSVQMAAVEKGHVYKFASQHSCHWTNQDDPETLSCTSVLLTSACMQHINYNLSLPTESCSSTFNIWHACGRLKQTERDKPKPDWTLSHYATKQIRCFWQHLTFSCSVKKNRKGEMFKAQGLVPTTNSK